MVLIAGNGLYEPFFPESNTVEVASNQALTNIDCYYILASFGFDWRYTQIL